MNSLDPLFDFYSEVWLYIQSRRRDERWAIDIIAMAEKVKPTWQPSLEKLEDLENAYCRKDDNKSAAVIKAFTKAATTDLASISGKKVTELLTKICEP